MANDPGGRSRRTKTPLSLLKRSLPSDGAEATLYGSEIPPSRMVTMPTMLPVESTTPADCARNGGASASAASSPIADLNNRWPGVVSRDMRRKALGYNPRVGREFAPPWPTNDNLGGGCSTGYQRCETRG